METISLNLALIINNEIFIIYSMREDGEIYFRSSIGKEFKTDGEEIFKKGWLIVENTN